MAEAKKRTTAKKTTTARTKPAAAKRRRSPAPPPAVGAVLADLTVEAAVRSDLEKLGERDPELATSALAANALQLAREMDSKNSATSKSMCARALNETMDKLRELAPPPADPDAVDELLARRAARVARVARSTKKKAARA